MEVEELRAAMQRMGAELQRRGMQIELLQGERAGCLGELERELGRRRFEAGQMQSLRDELQQQVGMPVSVGCSSCTCLTCTAYTAGG